MSPSRAPCSGVELIVEERVEAVMPAEGIQPGRRECHDAQRDRLRVDYVYAEALPNPLALELTSIVDDSFRAGERATRAAGQRLTNLAEKEHWGGWLVGVVAVHQVKKLEPIIADVIRDLMPMREQLVVRGYGFRPNLYTADDLRRLPSKKAEQRFIQKHESVKRVGLEEIMPFQWRVEHYVGVIPMSGGRQFDAFNDQLARAVSENAAKLGEVGKLERHLAVLVDRFDLLIEPDLTPPPAFPPELDCLWVVHRGRDDAADRVVWAARSGESAWRVHVSPDEEMPPG